MVLVFVPFIIGYLFKNFLWLWISILIFIIMVIFVGIPILKNISKLKKEIKVAEEALNDGKDY
jgi:hydrogenase-4 membrane subunit HyfE